MYLAGCASTQTTKEEAPEHVHDAFTKHYEKSLFKVSEKGIFSVEMIVEDQNFKVGVNTADIIIHDGKDRDVVGGDIIFTPWMPEMGHGVFEQPKITERGGGVYSVENIILIMGGHWEMRINVTQGIREDSVIFDFPEVKAQAGHKHTIEVTGAPADLDVSSMRLSENKIIRASYQSNLEPVPVNKIHSWTLKVETPDGQPLTDANIIVDGDMPEHGHGLPTQPEVTQELDGGEYIVEGMKFSMPGWWVITFSIQTQDRGDTVSFNLFLKE